VIGMDVHPWALAGRAAIGGAGECLGGLGRAARASVRRAPEFELHRHATPPHALMSFANGSEVAGNSRMKIRRDCKTRLGISTAWPKNR
jgi:hypothetical protein